MSLLQLIEIPLCFFVNMICALHMPHRCVQVMQARVLALQAAAQMDALGALSSQQPQQQLACRLLSPQAEHGNCKALADLQKAAGTMTAASQQQGCGDIMKPNRINRVLAS